MNRLVYLLFSLPLLLSFLTSVEAGPACAKRNQGLSDCVEACKGKWGWPGFAMGTDRWGSVMTVTKTDALGSVMTQACRVRSSGALGTASTSASTTAAASSTTAPANVAVSVSVSTDSETARAISTASSASLTALAQSTASLFNVTLLSVSKTASANATSTQSSSSRKITALANTHSSSSTRRFTTSTKPATSNTPASTSTHTTPHTTSTPPPPATTSTSTKKTSTTSAPPQTTSQSSSSGSSSGATSQSDINAYLTAHNTVRAQHGAAALTWSDDLAAKAQTWANNCVFQHSGGKLGAFGENLAAGTGSSYGIASAVKSWTDEVSEYDPNDPQASHFTQVVWKSSTQVGCAVQSCSGIFDASFGPAKYFVCEYSPQGNIIGAFAQNVQV